MTNKSASFALEDGLDLNKVVTTGSVLHISEDYDDSNVIVERETADTGLDYIGEPVESIKDLGPLETIDENGFVKKKVLEEGGGYPVHDGNTVSVAFSGFFEGEADPFDIRKLYKPLEVDLQDSGLLPGLEMAIRSMLVGETSVFLLSYHVMYGELGVPPRIKPKADCIFYIKLVRSIITQKEGKLDLSEPNMFQRVEHEVRLLINTANTFHKTNNITAAIQLFRKSVFMLHKCRLANEEEEKIQENLLGKLYLNLANCYNKTKQPLKACTACNELKRINKLWNNHRALFANAKALRMIGDLNMAEKRLKKAIQICTSESNLKVLQEELKLLERDKEFHDQNKIIATSFSKRKSDILTQEFKDEVDKLIKNFKENLEIFNMCMPTDLNSSEIAYLQEVCKKEYLFLNKTVKENISKESDVSINTDEKKGLNESYTLGKYEPTPWDADIEALQDKELDDADTEYLVL